jgi:hypothetical protein
LIVFAKGLTDKGTTPKWFMKKLKEYFNFDFDPCPYQWDKSFDGLKIDWKLRNYCNPPYSDKLGWLKKAKAEQDKGNMTVFFLPVDTSTKWFNDWLLPNSMILFVKGRVTSDLGKTPAFSSLIGIMFPYGKNKGICKTWDAKHELLSDLLETKEIVENKICSECGYSAKTDDEFNLHLTRPFHLNSLGVTV